MCIHKKKRIKKPASLAFFKKSNFSWEENTVSKTKSFSCAKHSYRNRLAFSAAFRTASGEFQSPNCSWAMLSGLIYRLSAAHSLLRNYIVVVVFPDPFGPATTQSVGRFLAIIYRFTLQTS